MTPTMTTAPLPARHTMALTTFARSDSIQQRAEWNHAKYDEYKALYEDGSDLVALIVFYDAGTGLYYLADGFHRHAAARAAGLAVLPADVYEGTRRDALFYATSHNLHGALLSAKDKRKRVMTLLDDPEWSQWSDNHIAKHCGVAHSFVHKLRHERPLVSETSDETDQARTTCVYTDRHGQTRTMAVGQIGRKRTAHQDNGAHEAGELHSGMQPEITLPIKTAETTDNGQITAPGVAVLSTLDDDLITARQRLEADDYAIERQDLDGALELLRILDHAYGRETVMREVIKVFSPSCAAPTFDVLLSKGYVAVKLTDDQAALLRAIAAAPDGLTADDAGAVLGAIG